MSADAVFWDGFDTYGPSGYPLVSGGVSAPNSALLASEWTSFWDNGLGSGFAHANELTITVVDSLAGPGHALQLNGPGVTTGGVLGLSKTLPGSYARIIFGFMIKIPSMTSARRQGVVLGDGTSDQLGIVINGAGQIELFRASGTASGLSGTLLATSTQSISQGVAHAIKADITISDASGSATIWLDDIATSIAFSGDTQNTANATVNAVRLMFDQSLTGEQNFVVFDHFWMEMFSSAGGGDAAPGQTLIVETAFPTGDDSIDFAFGAAILGSDYSATAGTNAPGANQLVLRKFTPEADGQLDSVSVLPAATSGAAKFKMTAYADSAGAPGALLTSGTEVVGCTAGAALTGVLTTPQALTAGTPIWIGFITDTAIALSLTDTGVQGRKVANTYASGAPAAAGAMSLDQASWVIFGSVSGVTDFWTVENENPYVGDLSYMVSSTVGDEDLYSFPALSSTPTAIYGLAIKITAKKADAGARTVDLRVKSAATIVSGDNAGQAPAMSYASLASYFRVDPDTSAAWNASGVNLATAGYKIAS